jgi:phage-related protein
MAKERESKRLVRLSGEIKTPPLSQNARTEAGFLLRQLQDGVKLSMPRSRPMSSIGPRCHELRIQDENRIWRIVYRIDPDVIVIAGVFPKTTQATEKKDIENCKATLRRYDADAKKKDTGKGK